MELLHIFLIAIALSMDALAVSVVNGCIIKNLNFKHALRIAFFFGLFQAVMPLAGWAAGLYFRTYIEKIDHWIAFVLLLFIGGKMIYESTIIKKDVCEIGAKKKNCLDFTTLILLSIATSIDALAVGISFSILNINIIEPILIIGAVTFVMCFFGVLIGDKIGHFFEDKLEIAGGVILILMGFKILFEHIYG
jgi:manganese efflux pump family protein